MNLLNNISILPLINKIGVGSKLDKKESRYFIYDSYWLKMYLKLSRGEKVS